ncbi:hypothetical protein FA95DRAFT_127419 [Auriscalpium vulgare]|uniref:Uncharacterized protein n=1 Tax=Auriscalpium vulgare TaxID=40419 RepID=A0ACB8RNW7_9AGAM|nr:hypothetical protein FA95DRAFT_127419 [Auriscalpium vulgare]
MVDLSCLHAVRLRRCSCRGGRCQRWPVRLITTVRCAVLPDWQRVAPASNERPEYAMDTLTRMTRLCAHSQTPLYALAMYCISLGHTYCM